MTNPRIGTIETSVSRATTLPTAELAKQWQAVLARATREDPR